MAIGRISGPMLFNNLERQGVDLAFQSNLLYLDVNNLRVGIQNSAPNYILDTPGNVKLANIIIEGNLISSNTGKINFGSLSNIVISGGSTNQVLYTDGLGNLEWGEISQLDPTFGNISLSGNVISTNSLNGNLILAANGTGSVTTTNDFYAGNIYALNIVGSVSSNGGAFTGNVSAPWFIGNLSSALINSNYANITYLQTNNLSSGNVLISGGVIYNVDLQANNFSAANALITGGNISNTNAQINNFSSANTLISGGTLYNINLQANNLSTANALISGGVIYNVNLQANNFSTANALITSGSISNTDAQINNLSSANILVSGGILYNTDVQANNFSTANALISSGNVTANLVGNLTGTFGNLSGNVNANWFIGNIEAQKANFSDLVFVNSNLTVSGNLISTGSFIATGNVVAQKITSLTGDLHISAATDDPNNIIRFDSVSAVDIASGNTAQRPPSPDYGYLRYNTDQGSIEWWTGAAWIQGAQTITSEIIIPDGINSVYTLAQSTTENSILVNINGTIQQSGAGAYSVSGNQITFAEVPLVTDIIEIRYIAGGVAVATYGNAQVSSYLTSHTGNIAAGNIIVTGNTVVNGNLNISSTSGTPGNTSTPASWLKIYVGGAEYFLPLYQ